MNLHGGIRFIHRLPAIVLVLSTALGAQPVSTVLAEGKGIAGIRGIIYQSNPSTRLGAARVIAINVRTDKRFESNLTGSNGAFEIKGMPAGRYDIVIVTGGRLFVTENLIQIGKGQRITISFSVAPRRTAMRRLGTECPVTVTAGQTERGLGLA